MTSKVYAYKVLESSIAGAPVGGCIVDRHDEGFSIRHWSFWRRVTGEFSVEITAERRDRLCAACYAREDRLICLDGHIESHGDAPQYEPEWIKRTAAAS